MTFSAAYMRLRDRTLRFLTIGGDLNAPLEERLQGAPCSAAQLHELAGIRLQYAGHRAGAAQIAAPALSRRFEQATLFTRAATEVVSIEVLALSAGRCPHFAYVSIMSI